MSESRAWVPVCRSTQLSWNNREQLRTTRRTQLKLTHDMTAQNTGPRPEPRASPKIDHGDSCVRPNETRSNTEASTAALQACTNTLDIRDTIINDIKRDTNAKIKKHEFNYYYYYQYQPKIINQQRQQSAYPKRGQSS